MSDRESLDVSGQPRSVSPHPQTGGQTTKPPLFPAMAPSCQKPYNGSPNNGYNSSSSDRNRLIVPTAMWVLAVVASLCFLSLLSSLNKSISRLDEMVELNTIQKHAVELDSLETILDKVLQTDTKVKQQPSTHQPKNNNNNNNNNKKQQLASELEQEQLGWLRMPEFLSMPHWTSLEPVAHHHQRDPRLRQDSPLQMMDDLMRQMMGGGPGDSMLNPNGLGDGETLIITSSNGGPPPPFQEIPAIADIMESLAGGPLSDARKGERLREAANSPSTPITANIHKLTVNFGHVKEDKSASEKKRPHSVDELIERPPAKDDAKFLDQILQQMMVTMPNMPSRPPMLMSFDEMGPHRRPHPHRSHHNHRHHHRQHNHGHESIPHQEQLVIVPLPDSMQMVEQPDGNKRLAPYEIGNQSPDSELVALADNLANQLAAQIGGQVVGAGIRHGTNKPSDQPHLVLFDNIPQRPKHRVAGKQMQPEDLFKLFFGPPPKSSLTVAPQQVNSDQKQPHVDLNTELKTTNNNSSETDKDNSRVASSQLKRPAPADEQQIMADMMDQLMGPLITMGQFAGEQSQQHVPNAGQQQQQQQQHQQQQQQQSRNGQQGQERGKEATQSPTLEQANSITLLPSFTVEPETRPDTKSADVSTDNPIASQPTDLETSLQVIKDDPKLVRPAHDDIDSTGLGLEKNKNQVFPEPESNKAPTTNSPITPTTANEHSSSVSISVDGSPVSISGMDSELDALDILSDKPTRSPAEELNSFKFENLGPLQTPTNELPTIIEGSRTTFSPGQLMETLATHADTSPQPPTNTPSSEITPSPSTIVSDQAPTSNPLTSSSPSITTNESTTKIPPPIETATNKTGGYLKAILDKADDFVERNMVRFRKLFS